jgi:general secretion pathway protein G
MKKTFRQAAAQGFTLIELLIVVIIIAILAAIAIPQFANTGGDAQESALSANLNTVRSALELYRVQHAGVYPSAVGTAPVAAAATACTGAGGIAGNAAVNSPEAFTAQLTNFSNSAGGTCSVAAPGFILGPYLREIPNESISNPPVNTVVIANAAAYAAPAAATPGWIFFNNANVGRFVVNSNTVGRRNIPLSQY